MKRTSSLLANRVVAAPQFALVMFLLIQGARPSIPAGVVTGEIRTAAGAPVVGVRVAAVPIGDAESLVGFGQTDESGRYRIEGIPVGRYTIMAGLIDLPTYYPGVKTIAEAQSISVVSGGTVEKINFSLAQSVGVRVSGRFTGLPIGMPSGLIRVMLSPQQGVNRQQLESLVRSDGGFEFSKVSPGTYSLGSIPSLTTSGPAVRIQVAVNDRDIDNIALNAEGAIFGRVVVDDGGPLPEAKMMSQGIPSSSSTVRLSARLPITGSPGGSVSPVRATDGAFVALLRTGEYKLTLDQLPLGYALKSITQGTADLSQSVFKVGQNPNSEEIVVTLATKPLPGQPPWRTIRGRVFGMPDGPAGQQAWIVLQASVDPQQTSRGLAPQRSNETTIRPDGTFEIPNVPSGVYALRVMGQQLLNSPVAAVSVEDSDIEGVELQAGNLRPPTTGAAPSAAPAAAASSLADFLSRPILPVPMGGVSVSGRVTVANVNNKAMLPSTIALFGSKHAGQTLETAVAPDGVFSFSNVQPGAYEVRTLPLSMPAVVSKILVDTRELSGLQIALPPLTEIRGEFTVGSGKTLPAELAGIILTLRSSEGSIDIPFPSDGKFTVRLRQATYDLGFRGIPSGYAIESVQYAGAAAAVDQPLNIAAPFFSDLRITIGSGR